MIFVLNSPAKFLNRETDRQSRITYLNENEEMAPY